MWNLGHEAIGQNMNVSVQYYNGESIGPSLLTGRVFLMTWAQCSPLWYLSPVPFKDVSSFDFRQK